MTGTWGSTATSGLPGTVRETAAGLSTAPSQRTAGMAAVAHSAAVAGFLSSATLPAGIGSPCQSGLAGGGAWSSFAGNRRTRGNPHTLSWSTSLTEAELTAMDSDSGVRFKLNAAPDEDGLTDPETEAEVDALNDAIGGGPDEGQTYDEWRNEIEAAHDALYEPDPGCERFDPPSTGDCSMVGNLAVCAPPCVLEQQSGCDIDTLPFEEADGRYDLVYSAAEPGGTIDWEMVDMVQYAWAVLLDNLDLVAWTACLFYGESTRDSSFWENLGDLFGIAGSVAECLVDKIEGRAPDVTIQFVTSLDKGAFSTHPDPLSGGTIKIPVTGSVWANLYVAKYKGAQAGSAEEFCIIADLAATLLHELVHSCLTGGSADAPGGDDNAGVCSTSYLIENSFRWALGQRYPCLCASASCDYYFDDRTWRSDGAAYPGQAPF